MSEMVKRVMVAQIAVVNEWFARGAGEGKGLSFHDMAKAAITAMHEPTEAMLAAFTKGYCDIDPKDRTKHDSERGAWQAMIDAALKE